VDTTTGQAYAVKVIPKRADGKDRAAFIAREVHMWRMLAALSPRVAGLQGAYQDANNIFLVQELLLDDLQKLLDEQGVLPEYEAATAMRCVMEALAALHAANVVYGDVKPSNFVRTKVRLHEDRLHPRLPAHVRT
jgi:serine/threonine protein kinase